MKSKNAIGRVTDWHSLIFCMDVGSLCPTMTLWTSTGHPVHGKKSSTALKFCQATNMEWSSISVETLRKIFKDIQYSPPTGRTLTMHTLIRDNSITPVPGQAEYDMIGYLFIAVGFPSGGSGR
jgi:hypothetical protein